MPAAAATGLARAAAQVTAPGGSETAPSVLSALSTSATAASSLAGTGLVDGAAPSTPAVVASAAQQAAHAPQSAVNQVALQIARSVQDGSNRATIRLHPAELGQVEVRLEVGGDGRVQATILVDRPETLELLQRDLRLLEQALRDAGLEASAKDFKFNLRQGDDGEQQFADAGAGDGQDENAAAKDDDGGAGEWVSNRALDVTI